MIALHPNAIQDANINERRAAPTQYADSSRTFLALLDFSHRSSRFKSGNAIFQFRGVTGIPTQNWYSRLVSDVKMFHL